MQESISQGVQEFRRFSNDRKGNRQGRQERQAGSCFGKAAVPGVVQRKVMSSTSCGTEVFPPQKLGVLGVLAVKNPDP
jgi:hypothetical protein